MSFDRALPVVHDLGVGEAVVRLRSDLSQAAPAVGVRPDRIRVEQPLHRFRPTCLTVAVVGACDQACIYCHARPAGRRRWPSEGAIRAATRLVARQAAESGIPFVAGLHGDSEPLADPAEGRKIVAWIDDEARRSATVVRFGVTTSGVIDENCARWLGRRFASVTVSMDGPPEVHDQQRPGRFGCGTWDRADTTLRLLSGELRPPYLALRMTVTRLGVESLDHDVEWMARRYRPDTVVVQPVYKAPALGPDGEVFGQRLATARHRAAELGVRVVLPANRPGERHGPFCAPLQGNLLLTPDDRAAWCFADLGQDGSAVGAFDPRSRRFVLDHDRFRDLADAACTPPDGCADCANVDHCARGCPDSCVLESPPDQAQCSVLQDDLRRQLALMIGGEGSST